MPISKRLRFSIGFATIPKSVSGVWALIVDFLTKQKALPGTVGLSQMVGHPDALRSETMLKLPIEDVETLISTRCLWGFKVYCGSGSRAIDYYLTDYRGKRQDYLMACDVESNAKSPDNWTLLIEDVVSRNSCVGAWQYMNLYQFWQWDNTGDSFYEVRWGKRPPGYRTWTEPNRSVVAPQPDKVFLDVSLNPGRSKQLTTMIKFYPTAEMWLGPDFWQYAKSTKEEALAAGFWVETRDTPHYTYFKCWPTAFTRPDGEQGRMQQNLWKLFFHEDCEWPPGSGTICDEPMYGPPELMPQPPTSPK